MITSISASQRSTVEAIWKDTLGLSSVDADRTFMDLGGTSLLANQLIARLEKSTGMSIPVIKVFEHSTLRQFLKFLAGGVDLVVETPTQKGAANAANQAPSDTDRDVAIIGMACRFPGAESLEEFWQNLVDGKDSITFLKEEELSAEVPEELRKDPRYVRARGMIKNPFAMDAAFFDIGPMEAKLIDPQQRVLLEVAWDALENAAHGPGCLDGNLNLRTAVYAGIEDNTYYKAEIGPFPEAEKRAGRFSIMTGNEKDFVAMRIAHKLNLRGPAVSVHTACSTSLVAVIMACKSLRQNECDMAIAGGSSVHFPTHDGYYFQEGGVFSPDGHCRPFDKDAQGTIFTDGAGIVVLKRLKDAIRDRNTIWAVIKGGAINNDGGDKVSFSAPSITGQSGCITDALADARVDAADIQFLEAHGTATPMGDPIEVEALRRAFSKTTQKKQYCALGSVKSNIGHTTTAAGVASLIKTALALKYEKIPASLHFKSPNPGLEIENSPFYVVNRLTDWRRGEEPRRAGVSSFGIGGTNSHAIIEEAPRSEEALAESAPRPFEIFPISAKTTSQRDKLLEGLSTLSSPARDIAYSLQFGRSRLKARGARIRLKQGEDIVVSRDSIIEEPKLAFMFPGQGSQYIEMGKSLYENFAEFRATFETCCQVLSRELELDFKSFIFDSNNKETLENTRYTQPALFAIEVSLGKMLLGWGIKPDLMIGHSIGEFAAAHLSGVFSLEDGLKLIAARGRLMASLPRGKMLSVRGPLEAVAKVAGSEVDIASINSPVHSVLAGPDENIKAMQQALEAQNLPCKLLHTSHAFHSAMMNPVVEPFLDVVKSVKLSAPSFRIISTVTGEPMTDADATNPMYWANHLRATVRFSPAVFKGIEEGANIFVEIGPRTTLSSLAIQHLKGEKGTAFSTLGDSPDFATELGTFASALAKLWACGWELPWQNIWPMGNRIPLLQYPFERKDYRFSENRKPELARPQAEPSVAADEEMIEEEEIEVAAVAEIGGEELLTAELGKLFSEHSGLAVEALNSTFVENGFDSLVLMQIGVELGKKFGVSVSLRDLMEKQNTLKLLAKHIAEKASPDKLPKAQAKQSVKKTKLVRRASASMPTAAALHAAMPVLTAPSQITPMPADAALVIRQQLTQMKEVLELQIRYLDSVTRAGDSALATAAVSTSKPKNKLIRAKHLQPPVSGAFRARPPGAAESWVRLNPENQRYEILT